MEKIHRDRDLAIDVECPANAKFRGERQDLEEMIGNLVDNACKWATSRVNVEVLADPATSSDRPPMLHVVVDDDGPGLSPAERAQVARRGQRLDESKPGSGLGLAIIVDLAALYQGNLSLGTSPIGGLRAELALPAA
jgi:signal transduction histidine kinase